MMIILNDYSSFQFTKIQVPILLAECPSDHENGRFFLDIEGASFQQDNCYIGKHFIEHIDIVRQSKRQWNFTIILPKAKNEDEVLSLLDELCIFLSFALVKNFDAFQYHGVRGFTYQITSVRRSYAVEDRQFGDWDLCRRGEISMEAESILRKNLFRLPVCYQEQGQFAHSLKTAFLRAMRSTDPVARYILLYCLFEIMYSSEEYRKTRLDLKKGRSKYRNLILFDYLQEQFHIDSYHCFGEDHKLSAEILEKIILTRDRLAHAANTIHVSEMMYHHMIPIFQKVFLFIDGENI